MNTPQVCGVIGSVLGLLLLCLGPAADMLGLSAFGLFVLLGSVLVFAVGRMTERTKP